MNLYDLEDPEWQILLNTTHSLWFIFYDDKTIKIELHLKFHDETECAVLASYRFDMILLIANVISYQILLRFTTKIHESVKISPKQVDQILLFWQNY